MQSLFLKLIIVINLLKSWIWMFERLIKDSVGYPAKDFRESQKVFDYQRQGTIGSGNDLPSARLYHFIWNLPVGISLPQPLQSVTIIADFRDHRSSSNVVTNAWKSLIKLISEKFNPDILVLAKPSLLLIITMSMNIFFHLNRCRVSQDFKSIHAFL